MEVEVEIFEMVQHIGICDGHYITTMRHVEVPYVITDLFECQSLPLLS